MPKYRSITLSIVSQWELRLHPEFPHPHSEKFRTSTSTQSLKKGHHSKKEYDSNEESEDEEDIQEYSYSSNSGTTAQVSVYIPSCPGTRFWIRYTISPDHPPAKLFYFKMFLNGRHITSWGCNPKERPSGQVMRALFNPEPEENSRFRRAGIESRPFFFAPQTANTAAVDGGLIEIKCFRAKGRRIVAADPEDFRGGQEDHGLELPKGGLLDCPQEARFYDWLLVDPKDSPYASFRFYYRSWEHLVALSLISPPLSRTLLPRSSSMWSTRSEVDQSTKRDPEQELMEGRRELEYYEKSTSAPETSGSNSRPLPTPGSQTGLSRHTYSPDRPPTPFTIFLSSSLKSVPTERLLPTPLERPRTELRRTSSQISTAHSITPSLHSYVDRESNSESPEPFVGVADAVPVLYSSPMYEESYLEEGYSQLSVESPQRQIIPLGSYGIVRPPQAMFSPESVAALRQNKDDIDFVPNIQPTKTPTTTFYSDRFKVWTNHNNQEGLERLRDDQGNLQTGYGNISKEQDDTTVGLGDNNWPIRTPSPIRKSQEYSRVEGGGSPYNTVIRDMVVPFQPIRETLEYEQLRDHTSLPLPMPRPQADPQRRIRTWI